MGRMNRLMQTANDTLALKSRPWHIDPSKLLLLGIAGIAALAIVGLLTMIVWMSLRTGVTGHRVCRRVDVDPARVRDDRCGFARHESRPRRSREHPWGEQI